MVSNMGNYKYDVSVVVLTYNPDLYKLIRTLKSILFQTNVNFEIVVSDDCSETNFWPDIKCIFNNFKFENFKLVKHKENVGTVSNLLGAVKVCEGKYIKDIGQGDFFASDDVLFNLFKECETKKIKGLFSDVINFCNGDNCIQPLVKPAYPQSIDQFDCNDKLFTHYVKCNDTINGATTFIETSIYEKYLNEVAGFVKFSEDQLIKLMVIDNVKLGFLPLVTIFYEVGSGVSSTNESIKTKLKNDNLYIHKLICQRLSSSRVRNKFNKVNLINIERKNRDIIQYLNWILRDKDIFANEVKRKLKPRFVSINFDYDFVKKCVECEVNNASN